MKYLIILISVLSNFSLAKDCFELDVSNESGELGYLELELPKGDTGFIDVVGFDKETNQIAFNNYYCIKNVESYLCIGDDDSGRFEVHLGKKPYVDLFFITLTYTGEDSFGVDLSYEREKMNFEVRKCSKYFDPNYDYESDSYIED